MMMRWSLDDLYTSFDSPEFLEDVRRVPEEIAEMEEYAAVNFMSPERAGEKIAHFLTLEMEVNRRISKVMAFANLTLAVNARHEEARAVYARMAMTVSNLTGPEVRFQRYLGELGDLAPLLEEDPLLSEHSFYLHELQENARYLLSDGEERLLAKLTTSGSKAWTNLQNLLSSTLLVEMEEEGKIVSRPLPAVRNLAHHEDAKVRRNAHEVELKAYRKIEESSAAALNGIKGEVLTVSALRGFSSPLAETLFHARMEEEILNSMLTAIREYLPAFRRYLRRKAEILGHKNGLPFADLFAPLGKSRLHFTYDEAMEYIVRQFSTFSPALGEFARHAHEKNWLDVEPRDGKRGGAFCSNLHAIGQSRIMANFDGSFSNLTTLAHELGHGYHGHNLKKETILNSSYPMPIAETASIFCETIVVNAALSELEGEEALTLLEQSISDACQVIVDIYSRFLFESELFAVREDHPASVEELKAMMLKAQKEAYGEGLDPEHLHPYMWLNKTHYYFPNRNFYNFPYAFGLLFSKGLYAEYLKRGEAFVPAYDELLAMTGKNSIREVALTMGIDVTTPDFFRSSLELVAKDIEKFLALTDPQKA
ncbi:M3 family oligoendopeptidase [Proteiniclasticum sp. BAD-10]|uniref:M3 family oligoendopeptidase n=2 Tax=Proteiniclasticum sediminis TaxID=2804028 RepID=A0A941CSI4_9CLOT|nr:M3 family oligoendopeptidase [Proteiniclasticum sediminis]